MEATGKAARFMPDANQLGMLSGIVLMFLFEVLRRYTSWDWRICFLVVAIPIWIAQGFLCKTPPKKWAIQVLASLAVCCVAWELLNLLWK